MSISEECKFQIKLAFDIIDANKDGYISCNELKNLTEIIFQGPITDAEVEEFIKKNDIDMDGRLDYEEFLIMWIKTYGEDQS